MTVLLFWASLHLQFAIYQQRRTLMARAVSLIAAGTIVGITLSAAAIVYAAIRLRKALPL